MTTSVAKRNNLEVLQHLLDDPTRSVKDLAKRMRTYRQKVWREKKQLEDEHIVWGYTAVVDESKLDQGLHMMLFKGKPMDKDFVDLFTGRICKNEFGKMGIRLINVLYVNGEYDFIIMFSAPTVTIARRYFDCLRSVYGEYLLEKPQMININFQAIREGKRNPELRKLYDFVPE
jgi:DNA-binding Lrp family transcriptional regulator